MKTLGITIAIIFGTVQMYASDLIITGKSQKPFSVKIEGRNYDSYQGRISISNLNPGTHKVAIFSAFQGKGRNNRNTVTYQHIQIPAKSIVYAMVNNHNNLAVTNIDYIKPTRGAIQARPRPVEVYVESRPRKVEVCETNYKRAMSEERFNDLYNYLSHMKFDTERANATKNAIYEHNFTAAQAFDLVSLFNFEDLKLEIAKLAYDKTIDQHNYYKVFDLLSFESSKQELDRFTNKNHYYQNNSYSYSDQRR